MIRKKALPILLILLGVVFSFAARGQGEELVPQKDVLQQIIDLVVENNPILQSQRDLLHQIEDLPIPKKDLGYELSLKGGIGSYVDEDKREIWTAPTYGVNLEVPLFGTSKQTQRMMNRLSYIKELEQARQDYNRLKSSIISELLTKVNKLYQLQNQRKNLEKLKSFLNSNAESLKRQVEAGVVKASDLWELTERIMNTNAEIYNVSSELEILKREIAITLGGEKWQELRQMLEQLMRGENGG